MRKIQKENQNFLSQLTYKEEQPYIIPENWSWVRLEDIGEISSSKRVKKADWENQQDGIPFYRAREIVKLSKNEKIENGIYISEDLYKELSVKYGLPTENDLLITAVGTIGVPYVVKKKDLFYFKDASVIWFKNKFKINSKFLYYYFLSDSTQNYIINMSSGSTVETYTLKNAKNTLVPLPPFNEQHRISNKIESLLNKIEETQKLIEEAKESFELRRASILYKSFKGEISSKWRENNIIEETKETLKLHEEKPYQLPLGWKWGSFNDIAKVRSNLVDPSNYKELPHIAPNNIERNSGKLLEYRTIKEDGVKSSKHHFYPNQIIYSKIRPYLSKVIIAEFEGLCSADMYPIETWLDKYYLFYYMLSPYFLERASTAGSRSVLPKINQKELGKIPVPIPPVNEQKIISNKLKSILDKEHDNYSNLATIEQNTESLKSSILSKAFRGELGTNDSTEENAIESLNKLLQKHVK